MGKWIDDERHHNFHFCVGSYMISLNVICVGNLKEKFWREAQAEYLKRLSRFCNVKVIEVEECNRDNPSEGLLREGKAILSQSKGYIILLDREGKLFSSEELSDKIQKISLSNSEISFIIGSSYGVSEEVKARANERLSFGKATFPHNLARIMLEEQIYRAFTISNNIKYHK